MIGLFANPRVHPNGKIAIIMVVTLGCLSLSDWPFLNRDPTVPASVLAAAQEYGVTALQADDPSKPGTFQYRSFTYSSGKDLHRDEFGDRTNLISNSVNAFAYIEMAMAEELVLGLRPDCATAKWRYGCRRARDLFRSFLSFTAIT